MQNLLPFHYCFIITTIISQPIKNVIICATVLEEIRHRNIAAYGRVRTLLTNNPSITYTSTDAGGHNNTRDPLLKDSGKNFFFFSNEHHVETYTSRLQQETMNDRNDRAIRNAARFYNYKKNMIFQDECVRTILLTEDKENLKAAREVRHRHVVVVPLH